ncbi:IS110 family transposase [Curtanaerobium respiraculi]|uniref:IS110 family transposase n=1 Tax=Curtanaerobium respiraculi TaxID=2949669 RepID=UPI0024B35919|nr:IS110 family transposase [Curtanaerobium respiraculi]
MPKYTINAEYATLVAIDQHARSSTLSALDLTTGERRRTRLTGCPSAEQVAAWARGWATAPCRFAYESGPCGFGLLRGLRALGHGCDVIAVASIPRDGKDKLLKDDRRDADRLLSEMANPASKIRSVWVPDAATEGLRDLTGAYLDASSASRRSKLQAGGFLLRHGHVWDERTKAGGLKKTWTPGYMKWLSGISFADPRAQEAFKRYVKTATEDIERARSLARRCREAAEAPAYKPYADALCRLKGVDAIGALVFIAAMGDFSRFRNGRSVSAYFGLVPTKHDSGPKVGNNGRITKAGDTSCRRAAIEALAGIGRYNAGPKSAPRRGHEVSAAVEAEALRCNVRIAERYKHLVARGKPANAAKTAAASELVRDMWAMGMIVRAELAAGE